MVCYSDFCLLHNAVIMKNAKINKLLSRSGLETNARPLARGELNSVRASGSSDLTSPVGEWEFYGDLSIIS